MLWERKKWGKRVGIPTKMITFVNCSCDHTKRVVVVTNSDKRG